MSTKDEVFVYSWVIDDSDDNVIIQAFGLNKDNKNVLLNIQGFYPYCYIEVPKQIIDNISMERKFIDRLKYITRDELSNKHQIDIRMVERESLYYANIDEQNKNYLQTKYLFCEVKKYSLINKIVSYLRKPIDIDGQKLNFKVHEHNASPILQLVCNRNINTCGWLSFNGRLIEDDQRKISDCEFEYYCDYRCLNNVQKDVNPNPYVMSFDLEVNSSDPNRMPRADIPDDKIFQISCIGWYQGSKNYEKYLLTLGEPDQTIVGDDVEIQCFSTESQLLIGFSELVKEKKVNILTGYNIFTFDIPYLIKRAEENCVIHTFNKIGFIKGLSSEKKTIKWSSSAYKNQEFEFIDIQGRIFVDLLTIVKRDFKFSDYKLKTVSEYFLGESKDPLTPKGIFKCYRIFSSKSLGICGKYCVVDSLLVASLFDLLQVWPGLTETAKTCNVPIFALYTQGQQVKVFSQIYRECYEKKIVVQNDIYKVNEDEHFEGAYVVDPIPGLYDNVVSFDFSSLYPSIIMAYNIDYRTLVTNENIPDEICHVIEWESHVGCEHDTIKRKTKVKNIICGKYRYRFLKEPKGILPTLLKNLLDARKKTNKEIAILKEKVKELSDEKEITHIKSIISVLDKRQLSYKISANSAYGAMGVKKGYLPLMIGAMCVTAKGRQSIEMAGKYIKNQYGAKLIYGDSVSKDTPIMIKYSNGSIDCKRIDELCEEYEPYDEFKKEDSNRKEKEQGIPKIQRNRYFGDIFVWTKSGWSKINRVIRHKTIKKMFQVVTHTGVVNVTEDHSLLRENGEKIKPTDIKIGEKLLHGFPNIEDIPETLFLSSFVEGKVKLCEKCNVYRLNDDIDRNICKKCMNPKYFSEEEYFGKIGCNLTKEEAFVWGMFFAEGSCGIYKNTNRGYKYSWAINNQDNELLEKCKTYLEKAEPEFTFKILDCMKSSSVNKLVCCGQVRFFVKKYRMLFYDNEGNKKVPYFILNSPKKIQEQFIEGYYIGDGNTNVRNISGSLHLSIKGKIGAQGLYILLKSLGYKYININSRQDKPDIYKIQVSSHYRKDPKIIKKIIDIGYTNEEEYVYDIETEDGTFHGGIGEMILKNTDSTYVHFPGKDNPEELYNFCKDVETEMMSLYPPPMKLAYEEKIYWRFFILTKKRYMALECDTKGVVSNSIFKRGVLLARRDNSAWIRNLYSNMIMKVFYREPLENIIDILIQNFNCLFANHFEIKDFIITKSVGDVGDYIIRALPEDDKKKAKRLKDLKCTEEEYNSRALPAQVQLAEKMRRRGKPVSTGTRLEYVVVDTGMKKDKLFNQIEDYEYFKDHKDAIALDFFYYLKLAMNPIDQVLQVAYNIDKFTDQQIKERYKKHLLIKQIKEFFNPKLIFKE